MTFGLTLIFVFMVYWRPQEWLFPWLFGWPVLDVVVYASVLMLMMESQQGNVNFPKRSPTVYLLGGIVFAGMVSHAVHGYFGGMKQAFIDLFKITFFTLLLVAVLDRPHRLRITCALIVGMCCFMAYHALLQDRRGYGFIGAPPLRIPPMNGKPAYTRSLFFGIFHDPNDMGQMLASSMPLVFAVPKRFHFIKFLGCVGVCLFIYMGFLTCHSRGGWVAFWVIVGAVVAMFVPTRHMPRLAVIGVVASLAAILFGGGKLLDASAWERVEYWGYGNMAFKRQPIFGLGYDMFWQAAGGRPAHNAFVTCYTELGVFGYWMWFNIIQLGVLGCWRVRMLLENETDEEARYMYRFCGLAVAALAGFSASAYFLSRTFLFPFFFLMALANAAPIIVERLYSEPVTLIDPKRDVLKNGTIISLLSIVYIYISILLMNRFH